MVIWRTCRLLRYILCTLNDIPEGLGRRFLPSRLDSANCRLRPLGWQQWGRDHTSRPSDSRLLCSFVLLVCSSKRLADNAVGETPVRGATGTVIGCLDAGFKRLVGVLVADALVDVGVSVREIGQGKKEFDRPRKPEWFSIGSVQVGHCVPQTWYIPMVMTGWSQNKRIQPKR